MKAVSKLLTKTKLKKVNLSQCDLIDENVLYLMQVLKDTQITHLDLSENDELDFYDDESLKKFSSLLLKSHLTFLNLSRCYFSGEAGALPLVQALPSSSITHLNLSECCLRSKSLASLFLNLPATCITDLDVRGNKITFDKLQPISRSLKNSKLKKLDISENRLGDKGVNLLAESLPLYNLISLNLGRNYISGANNLGRCLQSSKIENLRLHFNHIQQNTVFSFPNFVKGTFVTTLDLDGCKLGDGPSKELMKSLKDSAVTKLVVSGNNLGLASISEFTKIVKDTNIEDVDFSSNDLPPEAILTLGNSLKGSKIKRVNISYNFNVGSSALSSFIAKTKDTFVKSLKLCHNDIDKSGIEIIAATLSNTTISHVDFEGNKIGLGAINLAAHLSSTEITHLNLSSNDINDEGTIALADCLNKTQIVELNLNRNSITSCGAKALAASLKKSSLLSLTLNYNKIDDGGFEALAAETKNTFFNYFEGDMNEEHLEMSFLLFTDKYFWKNRILAHKLVSFFKQIAPETNSQNLCFDRNLDSGNDDEFLEECIRFYKTVKELPAAFSILAAEDGLPFSRKQIITLSLEEFPKQFITFVDRKIRPNVTVFIKFLKKVEEIGMDDFLRPLIKKPPMLNIDDNLSITHPFFCKLFLKYEQPFCSVIVEPQNKIKVIRYLAENPNIEGGLDMIKILCDEMLK